jgi:hypothetical protein
VNLRRRPRLTAAAAPLLVLSGLVAAGGTGAVRLAFTADTEGATAACESCAAGGGLGDLPRRATLVAALRHERPGLLLVDSGNALFGPDSLATGGRNIVAAYNELGYDAVNLSYRDFRLGKAATTALTKAARFPFVSANLQDQASGRLLAAPYVVKRSAGARVALIGVTEIPASVAGLEHVRAQLAGVRVRPAREALDEWLPKARAESDRVVLLYYGSAAGLDAVSRRFGEQIAVVLVGGLRPGDLPDRTRPPTAATNERGAAVACIDVPASGPTAVVQFPVDGRYRRDPRMLDVLKTFANPGSQPLM